MGSKDIIAAVRHVIENETKAACGEFTFEPFSLGQKPKLDLTSAVLSKADVILDEDDDELSFSRYLSTNFSRQPFVLVSKMRKLSVAEDSVKQSSPVTIRHDENLNLKTRIESLNLKREASELWGSPLKCNIPEEDESLDSLPLETSQVSLGTKKRKPRRLGIPLNWARKIISIMNTDTANKPGQPSLLVLCDGGDLRTTAVLGAQHFQTSDTDQTRKGIRTVTVTVDEKGSVESWNTKVKLSTSQSQTCLAVYQVSTVQVDGDVPWGTVAVEIKWKGASRLLETPPVDAHTAVKASIQSGNLQSPMNPFHQELQFLSSVITAVNTEQMEWQFLTGDKSTIQSMTTSVQSLINTLQEEGSLAAQTEGQTDNSAFDSVLNTFTIPERKDYDFTDRLWKVMQDCTSTADLVSSFRLVFRALSQGHLRPFVDRHNQTTMAQMVRESFTGRFSSPSLTGVQPFLFLAEMGAEKLRRDYIHIFLSQGLATPSALEAFISTQGELLGKLEDLTKLHSILEMVALLKMSLRLPSDTLGFIARQMLGYYRQHPEDPHHIFTFPVKTIEVRYVLGSHQPVVWCVEISNEVVENVSESTLLCLSASPPIFHLQSRPRVASITKGDTSEKATDGVELCPLEDNNGARYSLVLRKENVVII